MLAVAVGDEVFDGASVGIDVSDTVALTVGVLVIVRVEVTVGVCVTDAVGLTVRVSLIVRVSLRVGVGESVTHEHAGHKESSSRNAHVHDAYEVVAAPQMVTVQAGPPHGRFNVCCVQPRQLVSVTVQRIGGEQPELVALKVTFPKPQSSRLAA